MKPRISTQKYIAFLLAQSVLLSSVYALSPDLALGKPDDSGVHGKQRFETTQIPLRTRHASKANGLGEESIGFLSVEALEGMALNGPNGPISEVLASLDQGTIAGGAAYSGTAIQAGVASVDQGSVDLTIGKGTVLKLNRPASRIAISNPGVASAVILSPTEIQLIGNEAGITNLLIWDRSGSTQHRSIDLIVQRDVTVLSRNLRQIDPSLRVMPMAADNSVILTGEVDSREKASLALSVARAFFQNNASAAGGGGNNTLNSTDSGRPGSTIIGTGSQIINLIHVAGQPNTKLEMVQNKLTDIDPNIKLDLVPGPDGTEKAILTGDVSNAAVVAKALNMTSIFYGQPGIRVLTGPGGKSIRENEGSQTFHDGTEFSSNLDVNILQGAVLTDTTGNVVSMMRVTQKPQVRCNIKFLDVSRDSLNQLGSSFGGTFGPDVGLVSLSGAKAPATGNAISDLVGAGMTVSGSRTNGGTGVVNALTETNVFGQAFGSGVTQVLTLNKQFVAALSALENRQKARTLAEPNLLLLSGEKASFLAGGEQPIPVLGANGQIDVEYKEFGIRMNVIATVTEDNTINLQIAPEVSTIVDTGGVQTDLVQLPRFLTRRMQTTLEVQPGQSIILAGLYSQDESESMSRFPWIGSIPIIGSFFRSQFRRKIDNELVVVIRPEVVYVDGSGSNVTTQRQVSSKPQSQSAAKVAKTAAQPNSSVASKPNQPLKIQTLKKTHEILSEPIAMKAIEEKSASKSNHQEPQADADKSNK